MNQKLKVVILSDNRLLRESLGRILTKRSDFEVSACRGISEDDWEQAIQTSPDVIILDSAYFSISNAKQMKSGSGGQGSFKILLVAMDEDEELFLRAVHTGALGFIPKDASALDLVAAVRSLARDEAVCPARFCKVLFDYVVQSYAGTGVASSRASLGLTRREQQLIPLVDRGLTNKEIASHLNLSEKTIKNHIHRILRKVGAQNRMGLSEACRQFEFRQDKETVIPTSVLS